MSHIPRKILSLLFIVFVAGIINSCNSDSNDKLTIATAANAQFAIEEVAKEFEKVSGITTQIIIGSSGKHTAQIEAGAPYDVFVSADLKFPTKLYELGLTVAEPATYAFGKLVIWTLTDSLSTSINSLPDLDVNHIAMPNPKTAPYGKAAKEALVKFELYDQISHKLVFGESVAQTNQFILSKSAAIGFTAASIVMAPSMKGTGSWQEVEANSYSPIAQGVVVIKQSEQLELANKFYLFLFSPKAESILRAHGYIVNEKSL
jgi:molybdate transport system substrate-binding protein